jgi:site-specific DNA recombinase
VCTRARQCERCPLSWDGAVIGPVPAKAALGATKTRLAPRPGARRSWQRSSPGAPQSAGLRAIAARLNADPDRYPPARPGGWTPTGVQAILANPKYTGYMVYGRTRRTGTRRGVRVPADQWLWSPEPAHPAIITRQMWDAAQLAGAEHSTSRDDPGISSHPAARRTYVLRGRIRHCECKRRMCGQTTTPGAGRAGYTRYACPHDTANPRHAAACPDHPRSVILREDRLLEVIRQFFAQRIFGADRAALLAAALPAGDRDTAARRHDQAGVLRKQLTRIDAAENAHAREIEALADLPAGSAAVTALRTRLIARFTELEDQRAHIQRQLTALDSTPVVTQDPALLDALPLLGDILTTAPARLQQQLYQAFDLQILYDSGKHQVSIHAVITPSTPRTLAAILSDSEPPATPSAASHFVHATGTTPPQHSQAAASQFAGFADREGWPEVASRRPPSQVTPTWR